MNRRHVVQSITASGFALALAGCTDESAEGDEADDETDDDTDENGAAEADGDGTDAGEAEDEPGDEPPEQEFAGSGDDAVEDVTIEGGLTVVAAAHDESGDFEVRLIPESDESDDGDGDDGADSGGDTDTEDGTDGGNETDERDEDETDERDEDEFGSPFVDWSGEYDGQTAYHLEAGPHVLSVVADGDWEVTIRQPRDVSGESLPVSIDGSGNEVHGPYEFEGAHQPSGEYDGEYIIGDIISATDDSNEIVLHENNVDDPTAFEYEGVGYVMIKSDGEWSIAIE